ncbi:MULTISPECIES: sensor histidine kinase [Kitasatospora]|uniref:histidine kinase n=1 Tax=Kitasatospora setae (strain ATCC 33774 / DSM 43861 / JCM 3304 / KCC A-0304 / NBRC 14216 / KM-6054) TaxID=452652 RepID=E4NFV7_KITSK|nr:MULTISPECIES: sensor histidine kinase [Kitasatospora]BAJ30387.1 putative two-component system sensor kinase [Kitasatospora setae KM-6054]
MTIRPRTVAPRAVAPRAVALRAALRALGGCQLASLRSLVTSVRGVAAAGALTLLPVGLGLPLMAPAARLVRRGADRERAALARWTGHATAAPEPLPDTGLVALLGAPGFRRELAWSWLSPWAGGMLVAVPPTLVGYGLSGALVQPFVWRLLGPGNWYAFVPVDSTANAVAAAVLGLGFAAAGVWLAPGVLERYGTWTARLLDGPDRDRLERRIDQLTDSRSVVLDTQAAELRRIERDLHDGAQARLVALGLTLDRAEHLLDEDPATARRLLGEVRATSERALQELRDLVHGVLPPVLADRGLADAVRSLALDSFLDVGVDAALPGRLPAPVEAAAYFAVAELLANAAKHSGGSRVDVELRCADGLLRVTVRDDGRGGADPGRGSGLAGVRRRLAAFDGTLALDSPPGGPTTVILELPCASSSPKTSSSSATASPAP